MKYHKICVAYELLVASCVNHNNSEWTICLVTGQLHKNSTSLRDYIASGDN